MDYRVCFMCNPNTIDEETNLFGKSGELRTAIPESFGQRFRFSSDSDSGKFRTLSWV